eukprot:SAG31_NODE_709_length_12683_cov_17.695248_5_plen_191_part_00
MNVGFVRADGAVWAVPSSTVAGKGWKLPQLKIKTTPAMTASTTAAWDASNVIGDVLDWAERSLGGARLGWLSWIGDHKTSATSGKSDVREERICRVYGHSLSTRVVSVQDGKFIEAKELQSHVEARWVAMWQQSTDEAGRIVRRGIGVPRDSPDVMGYNRAGSGQAGCYVVGNFDAAGYPAKNLLRSPSY